MTSPEQVSTPRPLTFAEVCASQNESLGIAARTVESQLTPAMIKDFRGKSLLFAGIGSSFAVLGTPLHQLRASGVRAYRSDCTDVPLGTPPLADICLAVSASGRSREINQLILSTEGVRTLSVTNSSSNPLLTLCETGILVGDFPDSRVSSIGFTAILLALGMLSDAIVHDKPDVKWQTITETLKYALDNADDSLRTFAADIVEVGEVDVVAESAQITSAEEGALLFREGPFLPSTAMNTRSYLHGPMDSAGRRTSHVLFGRGREALLAEQLAEQKVPILLITDEDVSAPARVIRIPSSFTATQRSLIEIVLVQRLVSLVGAVRGIDIDAKVFRRLDTKVDSIDEVRGERV